MKSEINRLIVTDKGIEVSKDLKKEIDQNAHKSQWEDFSPQKNKRSLTPANINLPSGFQASLQSRKSIQYISMPVKSQFVMNSRHHSPNLNAISSNNFSTNFVPLSISQHHDVFQNGSHLHHYYLDGQPKSNVFTKSHESLGNLSSSSKQLTSTSAMAVQNKKTYQNLVSIQSLGGLKLNLNNLNYQKELNSQNELQKQQIQQVQQERLLKKYNEWNEQYLKSNELMKTKYYQKYEDISKLGDKEDEENFWKQWHQVKQSFDECLQSAEEQNQRYEDRLVRKLNKKYRNSFKNLPSCAKIKNTQSNFQLPKIKKNQ